MKIPALVLCIAAAYACSGPVTSGAPAQASGSEAGGSHLSAAARANLDALVAAYPDFLASHDDTTLVWKDGTRMPISDGRANKSADETIANPDIDDIFAWPYPAGTRANPPAGNADPGRARPAAFFTKMYGDCRTSLVEKTLARVPWVNGQSVRFTTVNGADKALAAVVHDLEALGLSFTRYLSPSAGAYECRVIAGTDLMSMHAFGAAIDINASAGEYWRWQGTDKVAPYHNSIPMEIVTVFERHGFIWGGRWTHFDTIHFEYRPELLLAANPAARAH